MLGMILPGIASASSNQDCEHFQPSAYLRIDKSGKVTVFVARQEMGQGVNTSLPMVVAEELEVDWRNVKSEIVEYGTFPVSDKDFGNPHDTGGSQSIPGSYDVMRKAGAIAKTMLIAAAAKEWGIKPEQCAADRGTVVNTVTMATIPYGELVCKAAAMPVPSQVVSKLPENVYTFKRSCRR